MASGSRRSAEPAPPRLTASQIAENVMSRYREFNAAKQSAPPSLKPSNRSLSGGKCSASANAGSASSAGPAGSAETDCTYAYVYAGTDLGDPLPALRCCACNASGDDAALFKPCAGITNTESCTHVMCEACSAAFVKTMELKVSPYKCVSSRSANACHYCTVNCAVTIENADTEDTAYSRGSVLGPLCSLCKCAPVTGFHVRPVHVFDETDKVVSESDPTVTVRRKQTKSRNRTVSILPLCGHIVCHECYVSGKQPCVCPVCLIPSAAMVFVPPKMKCIGYQELTPERADDGEVHSVGVTVQTCQTPECDTFEYTCVGAPKSCMSCMCTQCYKQQQKEMDKVRDICEEFKFKCPVLHAEKRGKCCHRKCTPGRTRSSGGAFVPGAKCDNCSVFYCERHMDEGGSIKDVDTTCGHVIRQYFCTNCGTAAAQSSKIDEEIKDEELMKDHFRRSSPESISDKKRAKVEDESDEYKASDDDDSDDDSDDDEKETDDDDGTMNLSPEELDLVLKKMEEADANEGLADGDVAPDGTVVSDDDDDDDDPFDSDYVPDAKEDEWEDGDESEGGDEDESKGGDDD